MTQFTPEIPQPRLDALKTVTDTLAPDSRGTGEIAKKVFSLQRGLTGERSLIAGDYMSERDSLLAYLHYYWPVSYAQAQFALRQLPLPRLNGTYRILDLGSGPGPMSCAAVDRIRDGIPAAASAGMKISVTVFDSSGTALDIAEKLLQNNSTRCPVDVAAIRGNLASDALPDGEFDLVLFGHSLNEIAHDKPDRLGIRAELARKAIGRLGYRGMLLIIEPALLSTSRDLIALRNELCAEGYPVHGPCTSDTACGILESSASATCHDESLWKIPRSVQKLADEAGLDRNAIKMTWFAFSKPDCPAGKHESVYRVVSEPMLNKAGRVRYLLCGSKNRMPFSAKKDDQAAAAGGFFLLARGDIVAIENPELRESGLGWRQDTKILRKEKFTS